MALPILDGCFFSLAFGLALLKFQKEKNSPLLRPHGDIVSLHLKFIQPEIRPHTHRRVWSACCCKLTLTFAERLDKAHDVGCLAGTQDLAEGPDVVLGEAERLDLGEFLGFGVTGDDFAQTFQSVVQPVHAVPLAGVSFHPTDLKPAETQSNLFFIFV